MAMRYHRCKLCPSHCAQVQTVHLNVQNKRIFESHAIGCIICCFRLTEFNVFRPSRPPQMMSLSSNRATPNCIRRKVVRFFMMVHLFNRGQKLSILIDPRWASIPPTASNLPTVDFRGRVRSDDIWARRSGIKCHLSASITSCWHSLDAHKLST